MTLYGIIYDWFYQFIWNDSNELGPSHLTSFNFQIGVNGSSIGMADWLCHTSTIIVLCAMCVALFFVVKWLFKVFAGLISGVGR